MAGRFLEGPKRRCGRIRTSGITPSDRAAANVRLAELSSDSEQHGREGKTLPAEARSNHGDPVSTAYLLRESSDSWRYYQ